MSGTMRDGFIGDAIAARLAPGAASQLVQQMLGRLLAGNGALADAGLAESDDWLAIWTAMLLAVDRPSPDRQDAFRRLGGGWSAGAA